MRVLSDWLLTSARVAVHVPTRTAVVADVHLGYSEVRQLNGDAVPRITVRAALAPIRPPLSKHGVRRIVIAGDLFEAGPTPELVAELLEWLADEGVELIAVVPGNHDRDIAQEQRLPIHAAGFQLGGWRVIHGDGPRPAGRVVQGHEHPLMRWANGLTAPCYLVTNEHLILPAFSTDAAGVNVLYGVNRSEYRCCAIAGDEVLDFGRLRDIRPHRRERLRSPLS
jgi:putative SbcD/Mre11-related phosphoesterase